MAVAKPSAALERLKSTALDLVALTSGMADIRLRRPSSEGGWSPQIVVAHLADAELVYAVRVRMVLTHDRPWLSAYDENAWAERFSSVDRDPKQTVERWQLLRDTNLRLFGTVRDEEWERTGVHAERGDMTLADLVEAIADHDRTHLDQIREALAVD